MNWLGGLADLGEMILSYVCIEFSISVPSKSLSCRWKKTVHQVFLTINSDVSHHVEQMFLHHLIKVYESVHIA